MSSNLKNVALDQIRTNPVALREVQRDEEQYQNLVADIARRGFLNPITVMEKIDEATNDTYYQIVDGLHRYSAACDNDLTEMPVNVLSISESEVIETQIVANLVKVDTKPVEYTKALQRMMTLNPTMTVQELADRISQSASFVMQRFSLLKLDEPIQKLVDSGEIKLANAYHLSKLPKDHQHEWTDAAMAQQPAEFIPAVTARIKELKEAARQGRVAGDRTFVATPRLRKLTEIKPEFETPEIGPALCSEFNATTAAEGFALAVQWVLHMDSHSVAAGMAKWTQQQKARDEEKKRRNAAREEKKRRESAVKAEEALSEANLSDEELEKEISKLQQQEADRKAAKATEVVAS